MGVGGGGVGEAAGAAAARQPPAAAARAHRAFGSGRAAQSPRALVRTGSRLLAAGERVGSSGDLYGALYTSTPAEVVRLVGLRATSSAGAPALGAWLCKALSRAPSDDGARRLLRTAYGALVSRAELRRRFLERDGDGDAAGAPAVLQLAALGSVLAGDGRGVGADESRMARVAAAASAVTAAAAKMRRGLGNARVARVLDGAGAGDAAQGGAGGASGRGGSVAGAGDATDGASRRNRHVIALLQLVLADEVRDGGGGDAATERARTSDIRAADALDTLAPALSSRSLGVRRGALCLLGRAVCCAWQSTGAGEEAATEEQVKVRVGVRLEAFPRAQVGMLRSVLAPTVPFLCSALGDCHSRLVQQPSTPPLLAVGVVAALSFVVACDAAVGAVARESTGRGSSPDALQHCIDSLGGNVAELPDNERLRALARHLSGSASASAAALLGKRPSRRTFNEILLGAVLALTAEGPSGAADPSSVPSVFVACMLHFGVQLAEGIAGLSKERDMLSGFGVKLRGVSHEEALWLASSIEGCVVLHEAAVVLATAGGDSDAAAAKHEEVRAAAPPSGESSSRIEIGDSKGEEAEAGTEPSAAGSQLPADDSGEKSTDASLTRGEGDAAVRSALLVLSRSAFGSIWPLWVGHALAVSGNAGGSGLSGVDAVLKAVVGDLARGVALLEHSRADGGAEEREAKSSAAVNPAPDGGAGSERARIALQVISWLIRGILERRFRFPQAVADSTRAALASQAAVSLVCSPVLTASRPPWGTELAVDALQALAQVLSLEASAASFDVVSRTLRPVADVVALCTSTALCRSACDFVEALMGAATPKSSETGHDVVVGIRDSGLGAALLQRAATSVSASTRLPPQATWMLVSTLAAVCRARADGGARFSAAWNAEDVASIRLGELLEAAIDNATATDAEDATAGWQVLQHCLDLASVVLNDAAGRVEEVAGLVGSLLRRADALPAEVASAVVAVLSVAAEVNREALCSAVTGDMLAAMSQLARDWDDERTLAVISLSHSLARDAVVEKWSDKEVLRLLMSLSDSDEGASVATTLWTMCKADGNRKWVSGLVGDMPVDSEHTTGPFVLVDMLTSARANVRWAAAGCVAEICCGSDESSLGAARAFQARGALVAVLDGLGRATCGWMRGGAASGSGAPGSPTALDDGGDMKVGVVEFVRLLGVLWSGTANKEEPTLLAMLSRVMTEGLLGYLSSAMRVGAGSTTRDVAYAATCAADTLAELLCWTDDATLWSTWGGSSRTFVAVRSHGRQRAPSPRAKGDTPAPAHGRLSQLSEAEAPPASAMRGSSTRSLGVVSRTGSNRSIVNSTPPPLLTGSSARSLGLVARHAVASSPSADDSMTDAASEVEWRFQAPPMNRGESVRSFLTSVSGPSGVAETSYSGAQRTTFVACTAASLAVDSIEVDALSRALTLTCSVGAPLSCRRAALRCLRRACAELNGQTMPRKLSRASREAMSQQWLEALLPLLDEPQLAADAAGCLAALCRWSLHADEAASKAAVTRGIVAAVMQLCTALEDPEGVRVSPGDAVLPREEDDPGFLRPFLSSGKLVDAALVEYESPRRSSSGSLERVVTVEGVGGDSDDEADIETGSDVSEDIDDSDDDLVLVQGFDLTDGAAAASDGGGRKAVSDAVYSPASPTRARGAHAAAVAVAETQQTTPSQLFTTVAALLQVLLRMECAGGKPQRPAPSVAAAVSRVLRVASQMHRLPFVHPVCVFGVTLWWHWLLAGDESMSNGDVGSRLSSLGMPLCPSIREMLNTGGSHSFSSSSRLATAAPAWREVRIQQETLAFMDAAVAFDDPCAAQAAAETVAQLLVVETAQDMILDPLLLIDLAGWATTATLSYWDMPRVLGLWQLFTMPATAPYACDMLRRLVLHPGNRKLVADALLEKPIDAYDTSPLLMLSRALDSTEASHVCVAAKALLALCAGDAATTRAMASRGSVLEKSLSALDRFCAAQRGDGGAAAAREGGRRDGDRRDAERDAAAVEMPKESAAVLECITNLLVPMLRVAALRSSFMSLPGAQHFLVSSEYIPWLVDCVSSSLHGVHEGLAGGEGFGRVPALLRMRKRLVGLLRSADQGRMACNGLAELLCWDSDAELQCCGVNGAVPKHCRVRRGQFGAIVLARAAEARGLSVACATVVVSDGYRMSRRRDAARLLWRLAFVLEDDVAYALLEQPAPTAAAPSGGSPLPPGFGVAGPTSALGVPETLMHSYVRALQSPHLRLDVALTLLCFGSVPDARAALLRRADLLGIISECLSVRGGAVRVPRWWKKQVPAGGSARSVSMVAQVLLLLSVGAGDAPDSLAADARDATATVGEDDVTAVLEALSATTHSKSGRSAAYMLVAVLWAWARLYPSTTVAGVERVAQAAFGSAAEPLRRWFVDGAPAMQSLLRLLAGSAPAAGAVGASGDVWRALQRPARSVALWRCLRALRLHPHITVKACANWVVLLLGTTPENWFALAEARVCGGAGVDAPDDDEWMPQWRLAPPLKDHVASLAEVLREASRPEHAESPLLQRACNIVTWLAGDEANRRLVVSVLQSAGGARLPAAHTLVGRLVAALASPRVATREAAARALRVVSYNDLRVTSRAVRCIAPPRLFPGGDLRAQLTGLLVTRSERPITMTAEDEGADSDEDDTVVGGRRSRGGACSAACAAPTEGDAGGYGPRLHAHFSAIVALLRHYSAADSPGLRGARVLAFALCTVPERAAAQELLQEWPARAVEQRRRVMMAFRTFLVQNRRYGAIVLPWVMERDAEVSEGVIETKRWAVAAMSDGIIDRSTAGWELRCRVAAAQGLYRAARTLLLWATNSLVRERTNLVAPTAERPSQFGTWSSSRRSKGTASEDGSPAGSPASSPTGSARAAVSPAPRGSSGDLRSASHRSVELMGDLQERSDSGSDASVVVVDASGSVPAVPMHGNVNNCRALCALRSACLWLLANDATAWLSSSGPEGRAIQVANVMRASGYSEALRDLVALRAALRRGHLAEAISADLAHDAIGPHISVLAKRTAEWLSHGGGRVSRVQQMPMPDSATVLAHLTFAGGIAHTAVSLWKIAGEGAAVPSLFAAHIVNAYGGMHVWETIKMPVFFAIMLAECRPDIGLLARTLSVPSMQSGLLQFISEDNTATAVDVSDRAAYEDVLRELIATGDTKAVARAAQLTAAEAALLQRLARADRIVNEKLPQAMLLKLVRLQTPMKSQRFDFKADLAVVDTGDPSAPLYAPPRELQPDRVWRFLDDHAVVGSLLAVPMFAVVCAAPWRLPALLSMLCVWLAERRPHRCRGARRVAACCRALQVTCPPRVCRRGIGPVPWASPAVYRANPNAWGTLRSDASDRWEPRISRDERAAARVRDALAITDSTTELEESKEVVTSTRTLRTAPSQLSTPTAVVAQPGSVGSVSSRGSARPSASPPGSAHSMGFSPAMDTPTSLPVAAWRVTGLPQPPHWSTVTLVQQHAHARTLVWVWCRAALDDVSDTFGGAALSVGVAPRVSFAASICFATLPLVIAGALAHGDADAAVMEGAVGLGVAALLCVLTASVASAATSIALVAPQPTVDREAAERLAMTATSARRAAACKYPLAVAIEAASVLVVAFVHAAVAFRPGVAETFPTDTWLADALDNGAQLGLEGTPDAVLGALVLLVALTRLAYLTMPHARVGLSVMRGVATAPRGGGLVRSSVQLREKGPGAPQNRRGGERCRGPLVWFIAAAESTATLLTGCLLLPTTLLIFMSARCEVGDACDSGYCWALQPSVSCFVGLHWWTALAGMCAVGAYVPAAVLTPLSVLLAPSSATPRPVAHRPGPTAALQQGTVLLCLCAAFVQPALPWLHLAVCVAVNGFLAVYAASRRPTNSPVMNLGMAFAFGFAALAALSALVAHVGMAEAAAVLLLLTAAVVPAVAVGCVLAMSCYRTGVHSNS